jgi:hypothetical protein
MKWKGDYEVEMVGPGTTRRAPLKTVFVYMYGVLPYRMASHLFLLSYSWLQIRRPGFDSRHYQGKK